MTPEEQKIYIEFRSRVDNFRGKPEDHAALGESVKTELAVKYDLAYDAINDILAEGYMTDLWDMFGKDTF